MSKITLNPTQLHLLRMFTYAKSEDSLEEIKRALTAYFAQKVEDEKDNLWKQEMKPRKE